MLSLGSVGFVSEGLGGWMRGVKRVEAEEMYFSGETRGEGARFEVGHSSV